MRIRIVAVIGRCYITQAADLNTYFAPDTYYRIVSERVNGIARKSARLRVLRTRATHSPCGTRLLAGMCRTPVFHLHGYLDARGAHASHTPTLVFRESEYFD